LAVVKAYLAGGEMTLADSYGSYVERYVNWFTYREESLSLAGKKSERTVDANSAFSLVSKYR